MKKRSINDILKEQIARISPSDAEMKILGFRVSELVKNLEMNIKKNKIKAQVFVGGSFARDTLIKKNKYDVDVFIRFDEKTVEEKLSALMKKIVPKNSVLLHGSRDYYSIKEPENIAEFEIIPVFRIKKPESAKNITDLSYFHVNYIRNKIKKNKKLADEIRLAKAFAFFQDCYGAESYINGFSGYGIELLVASYGSFLNFIRAVAKADAEEHKIILDPEKLFKNKDEIMQQMNESKLLSPIVFIDPTYKERNALAALSLGTFEKFKSSCSRFLKNPLNRFFESIDVEKKFEDKYRKKLIKLEITTEKQAGDIAGTKLKKFSGFFLRELERYFDVKASEFIYDEPQNVGKILLVVEARKEIVFPGPPIEMKKPLREFKKEHKKIKIIKGKAFAYEKNKLDFPSFLKDFENEKSSVIASMDIEGIKIA